MSNLVKQERELLKMSQEKLASKANISRVYLSRIERGKSMPSYAIASQISTALGKEVNEIFLVKL
ncbi:helix-turn-helix transcriptional regulator [Clostridium intestinale]|uniref:helix-turn-helix transcriptional regulator n=1 Tax=Clostridium intestinale TaxID=36845 RepID=UPI002DD64CBB|nr:helix-turn-helix transcriptional regulator [Clostridium intestinale]WRY52591.1 helix-turn-helix transcriptional regulator [Clostridium intestinale]